ASYPKRRVEHPPVALEQKDLFFNRDTRPDLKGFFAAAGPGISARGRIPTLSVLDGAPTCLHLMGQPVPEAIQGGVSTEIRGSVPAPWCHIPSFCSYLFQKGRQIRIS